MNVTLPEQRGRAQIKKDEELRETVTGLNRAVQNCRSVGLFHADSVQSQKYMQLTLEREAAQGHKALTMVRRAALKNLLEQEQQQYALELGLIGKAFYHQRI